MLFRKKERFTETNVTIDELLKKRGWLVNQMIDCKVGSEEHRKSMAKINKIDELIYAKQLELINENARNNRTDATIEKEFAAFFEGI